ncbi:DNA-processing protein DprA [Herbaspirillum lusitanum]|uniref:DNA-processing protein DprA n=1 Tax=Herbaspirillum lusitanum TaxID=213312 RepID=A0ABW9A7L2_9BURK
MGGAADVHQLAGAAAAHELSSWIRLQQTEGVGLETSRALLSVFGLPQHIFQADLPALLNVVSPRIAHAIFKPPSARVKTLIERSLEWAAMPGNRIVSMADADYPHALLSIADPPILLYVRGRFELLAAASLAVVGSRNASEQGMRNAEHFSQDISRAGIAIVSGLALGIDAAAHRGGLRGAGSTIAVIGTGADVVYPARNSALTDAIAEGGCIVSEYALGMPPLAANFPRRNRIISGLARAVLVVEAAAQSGSLITARMAAEQGRDVFAIPGSIHSPMSKGCHQLIKQGAKLIESTQDVLDELSYWPQPFAALAHSSAVVDELALEVEELQSAQTADSSASAKDDAPSMPLLHQIGFDPIAIDTLVLRTGMDASALAAMLLTLELDGQVELLPGGLYRRLV